MARKSINVEVKAELSGISKIRSELKSVKDELADALTMDDVDPAKIEALTIEAGRLKDQLVDINEQVDLFASGSKYEVVTKSFGSIGKSILSLDFGKASERAQAFATAAKAITFKDAIGSVKDLGKTFLSVGRALLTNPLFLIGAVIALIVVGIYKFLDSLGLIEDILAVLMAPLNLLLDGLKSLANWFSNGAISAQENAEKKAKAYEDAADRINFANNEVIRGIDNEIRMARLSGKDTTALERNKLKAIEDTARARARADRAAFEAGLKNKKLTKEEITALKEKAIVSRIAANQSYEDIKFFDAKVVSDKQKSDDKQAADDKKLRDDNAKKAAADRETKKQNNERARKEDAANRLKAEREIEDLMNSLLKEGVEKEIKINNDKYERLIADTKTNEKLKEEERVKIIALLEQQQKDDEAKIREEDRKKREDEEKAAMDEFTNLMIGLNENRFAAERDTINLQTEERLKILREQQEKGLITKEQLDAAEIALEEEKQRRLKEIAGGGNAELSLIDKAKQDADAKLLIEKQKLDAGIINEEEYAERIKNINKELEDFIREEEDKTAQQRRDNVNQWIGVAGDGLSSIGDLMMTSLENEINAAEEGSEKQEALRRKSFEMNKKFQIGNAIMGMAQGVIAGLGAPFPMNIALPIIAGVSGLANIAKIKSTTYQGGTLPDVPSAGDTSSAIQRSMPTANFMGVGNNQNTVGAGGGNNEITLNVNATVSETEITSVQNRNANRIKNAEL